MKILIRTALLFLLILFVFSGYASGMEDAVTPASAGDKTASEASVLDDDDDYEDDFDEDFDEDFEDEAIYTSVADPFEGLNRVMFTFNDKFYFWVLKPVVTGYKKVMPSAGRIGVKNFFHNITTPIRFASCLLQLKVNAAAGELGSFLVNTTIGVLGFGNPAKADPELNPPPEDLGQTLGAYKIGNGFYIVWPFLGASTLRDSVGMFGESYANPISYVEPLELYVAVQGFKTVNTTSFRIGDYETLKDAALDPYTALRDAYIQNRKSKISQ